MDFDRPITPMAKVWYVFVGLLVLTFLFPAPWVAALTAGYFIGAEHAGVADPRVGDTFSELVRYRIGQPGLRFAAGLVLSILVGLRVGSPYGHALAAGLLLWLPAHFAFKGWEGKLLGMVKRRLL